MKAIKMMACGVALATPCLLQAADLAVEVEIPKLNVAEYHRPYVAVWLENTAGRHQLDLAVWYDLDMRNQEGNKWLKDLRLWWRRSGRGLGMPVDGFSGASRAPGIHTVKLDAFEVVLNTLPAGDYVLAVEAAREVGGREVIRVPMTWPAQKRTEYSASGRTELGQITVVTTP